MTVLGEVEPSRAPWRERQFWSGSVIRNIVATGPKMFRFLRRPPDTTSPPQGGGCRRKLNA
jgi:hypothetical protein